MGGPAGTATGGATIGGTLGMTIGGAAGPGPQPVAGGKPPGGGRAATRVTGAWAAPSAATRDATTGWLPPAANARE
jgi:hypothetical protein